MASYVPISDTGLQIRPESAPQPAVMENYAMFRTRQRRFLLAVALPSMLAVGVGESRATTLYGVGDWGLNQECSLFTIDAATGMATSIGSTGVDRIGGLAFSTDGVLYGYDVGILYTIDTTTGAAQRVDLLGGSRPEGGLDFQPGTGTLFGLSASNSAGDKLLTIDTSTGQSTVVGDLGPGVPRRRNTLCSRFEGTRFGR